MSAQPVRTAEQARAALESQGVSIAKWATANGFSTPLVYEVLAGRKKCLRGQSHAIAVKLGIKPGTICTDPAAVLDSASSDPVMPATSDQSMPARGLDNGGSGIDLSSEPADGEPMMSHANDHNDLAEAIYLQGIRSNGKALISRERANQLAQEFADMSNQTTGVNATELLDLMRRTFPQELGQAAGVVLLPLQGSVQQAMEQGGLLSLLETPQIEILAGHPTPRVISLLAWLGSQSVQFPLQNSV